MQLGVTQWFQVSGSEKVFNHDTDLNLTKNTSSPLALST